MGPAPRSRVGEGSTARRDPRVTQGGMIRRSVSKLRAVGAEDRAQDDVQRDPHHRFEVSNGRPLGP